MDKGKTILHWGPWRKVLNELQTCPRCTIHMSLRLCMKPPRVSRNWSRDPSLMEQWPRRKKGAEGLTDGEVAPVRGRVRSGSLWRSRRGADRRRWWSQEVGTHAQAGELVGGEESGLTKAR
jgi:hypothetical protein